MAPICSDEKRLQIKQTRAATKLRRSTMDIKSYEIKLNINQSPQYAKTFIQMCFVEARWIYNWILNDIPNRLNCKIPNEIQGLNKDGEEVLKPLNHISSQMKQSVQDTTKANLSALSATKKKGRKVGRLKYKSSYSSINLKQPGITFKIRDGRLVLQGCKYHFKIFGLHQIQEGSEICSAKLIEKPSGYYLNITLAIPRTEKAKSCQHIGLDLGCGIQETFSNGIQVKHKIPVSYKTKKLQRKLFKKKKGSKNLYKAKKLLAKSHELDANKRKDITNKIYGYAKTFDLVAFQDDNIKGWHKGICSKSVQYSSIGAIKSRLKTLESAFVIDRWTPTTQPCSRCGALQKLELSDRIYDCPACGFSINRDLNASINDLILATNHFAVPMECRKLPDKQALEFARKKIETPYAKISILKAPVNDCGDNNLCDF